MAQAPPHSPPPRSVSETEPDTEEEAPQEYWCYHCNKRVSVETVPDIVCYDCKNGFVESIPNSDPPLRPSDQTDDPTFGSPFLQVLRLIARTLSELSF